MNRIGLSCKGLNEFIGQSGNRDEETKQGLHIMKSQ